VKIPQIIHQTWKTNDVPSCWRDYQRKVRQLHPGWEYRLWTDVDNDAFVRQEFPGFYPVYAGFERNIMRADVIRYLIMFKLGGMYLDLDYEFLKPFDFEDAELVLPMNRSLASGDSYDGVGNCVFASVPGHVFWSDAIEDLRNKPPDTRHYGEVIDATGPMFLTRIYDRKPYPGVLVTGRELFHPPAPHGRREYMAIVEKGVSYGIHHGWGSWKERLSMEYLKRRTRKLLSMMGVTRR